MHFSLWNVSEECSTFSEETRIWSTFFFFGGGGQLIFDKDSKTIQKRKQVDIYVQKQNKTNNLHYVQKPTWNWS